MDEKAVTRYVELMQNQLEEEQLKRTGLQNNQNKMSSFNIDKNPDIIKIQLDVKEELDRIFHLLSSHTLGHDGEGNEEWQEPKDDRLKILSEYGVQQIM